ncbi:MAG: flagellar basal-body MS-ring/collar protein FliF, partial [Pseudomonadota bacterium]
AQATSQFKYTRRLEETYKRRIEDLLTPLLGPGRIHAEVVADIDFTYVEETRESFDPNRTVVRSERLDEDLRTGGGSAASGVPGALSNQPPEAGGVAPEDGTTSDDAQPKNTSRSSVRNYEVDRTISHTRPQSNTIRRLSVAVLVDESPVGDDAQARTLSDQELERYTAVVKEAVGFNEARGDTVVVLGQAFLRVEDAIDVEAPPIWQQPFVKDAAKQVIGALIVLAIAFGVVRPMLRSVVASSAAAPISGEYLGGGHVGPMPGVAAANDPNSGPVAMPNYNEKVAAAKNLTGHDPARVAQVVKQWVATNE